MRPITLTMEAFGPYQGTVHLDFSILDTSELFLIYGPTGAGKTTVLDAMIYALYGVAANESRGIGTLRSQYADPAQETVVRFTFSLGAQQYRVERCPQQDVAKKRGTGTRRVSGRVSVARYRPAQDAWEDIPGKSKELDQFLTSLLGFTKEEFRQVVLLPQGEFRKVLLGSSTDRSALLSRLFHTDIYDRFQERLASQAATLRASVEEEIRRETEILELEGVATLAELADRVTEQEAACQAAAEAVRQQETAVAKLDERWQAYLAWTRAEQAWRQHGEQMRAIAQDAERMEVQKQRCQQLRMYEKDRQLRIDQETSAKDVGYWEGQRKTAADLELTWQSQDKALREAMAEWQSRTPNVEERDALQERLQAVRRREEEGNRLAKEREAYEAAKPAVQTAKEAADTRRALWEAAKAFLAQYQAYALAQDLVPGGACPVCGSTEHPAPAMCPVTDDAETAALGVTPERVNQEWVAQLERQYLEAEQTYQRLQEAQRLREDSWKQMEKNFQDLVAATPAISIEEAEAAYQEWCKQEAAHGTEGKGYQRQEAELAAAQGRWQTLAQQAEAEWSKAQARYETARQAWEQAVAEKAWLVTEAEVLEREILQLARWERECEDFSKRQAALEGQEQVRKDALAQAEKDALTPEAAEALEAECLAAKEALRQSQQEVGAMRQEGVRRKQQWERAEKAHKAWEDVAEEYTMVTRLSRLAEGKGDGVRKLSFKNYVLRMLLEEVLIAANQRLSVMSRNRYTLETAPLQETAKGQQGLDMTVFDAYTGQIRPVQSLSGGETFLASLSLALGLADVVQAYAGGLHVESMFIDEGFGTLDSETLDIAMEALVQLQASGRLVGIISHVEALQERIGARLAIRKTDKGSTARFEMPTGVCYTE